MTVSTTHRIVMALGGHRAGTSFMALCPAHEDSTPSLSIREVGDGKVLVHCHAGCDQRDVIAALGSRGLWDSTRTCADHLAYKRRNRIADAPDHDAVSRTEAALSIWRATLGVAGSPAETYLRSRGINLPPPPNLRFHPNLKHPSGGFWPVMVALVVHGKTGSPIAIHRTFVAHDSHGKAPVDPPKMMLGPCRGGVVRLSPASDRLMIGEGIETCLATMQATGHAAWAALSTSGLRALELPRDVRDVIILADGDLPGEAAAQAAANRWARERRRVRIARPPPGMDFNDVLLGKSNIEGRS